jgi:hypothetical protein
VNGRASRRHWIRNGTWAVIAALVPASECLAVSGSDPTPSSLIQSDSAEAGLSDSRGTFGTTVLTRIPPPRNFSEQEIKGRQAGQAVRSEIQPDRRLLPNSKSVELTDTSVAAQTVKEATRQAKITQATAPASTANLVAETQANHQDSTNSPTPGTNELLREALNTLGATSSGSQATNPDSSAATSRVLAPGDAQVDTASPQPEPELKPVPTSSSEGRGSDKSPERKQDGQVEQAGCATCGGFHGNLDGHIFTSQAGCASGNCIPGRQPCNPPLNECDTVVGAFMSNLYQCICCPDPCYEPKWEPGAYASLFADYARPRTVTRLRYDNLENMTLPDRNQFWINNVTPSRMNGTRTIRNLYARLQEVYLYQEAAGEHGSLFVEYPYRQINQSWAPTQAGFGDVNFGIKSLLFDCELLQIAYQMRTFMPSGNFMKNLGNGQFAVDPSILTSLKLGPESYFQGQFGNWVPLGGPGGQSRIAGGVFYWLMSLNQVLCYPTPDSPLIATLEMDGWSFQNGGYTPVIAPGGKIPHPIPHDRGASYFNIGPGLRQSICNRIDFGGAITWATNSTAHWAQPWFRFEVRFLF